LLKCFNCGKIGNFSNKYPYDNKSDSDEEEDPKKEKKYQNGNTKDKRKLFMKNIYSREDSSSYDEDNESDNDLEKLIFMARENQTRNSNISKEEGEFDLRAGLINALE
jgi:hypothetical protein